MSVVRVEEKRETMDVRLIEGLRKYRGARTCTE